LLPDLVGLYGKLINAYCRLVVVFAGSSGKAVVVVDVGKHAIDVDLGLDRLHRARLRVHLCADVAVLNLELKDGLHLEVRVGVSLEGLDSRIQSHGLQLGRGRLGHAILNLIAESGGAPGGQVSQGAQGNRCAGQNGSSR